MKNYNSAGILPITIHNNNIYFLIGKENFYDNWDGSLKFSEFGGNSNNYEFWYDTMIREFYEETMGIFGNLNKIDELCKNNMYNYMEIEENGIVGFLFIEYNEKLPIYYNNIYNHITNDMLNNDMQKIKNFMHNGFIEKKLIKWIEYDELKNDINENNNSYRKHFISLMNNFFNTNSKNIILYNFYEIFNK